MNNKNILDSMDVTPYESPVIILADGRVIYHGQMLGGAPGDDPVWMIGTQEEWQSDFDDLEEEKITALSAYADGWDGKATASNIFSYVSYYGHSRQMHEPDWIWMEFSGSVLNLYDEHTCPVEIGDDEENEEPFPVCDGCGKTIPPGEEFELPETEEFCSVTVCRECFDSEELEEHIEATKEKETT